jgi:polysaccharide export outer membrane protein
VIDAPHVLPPAATAKRSQFIELSKQEMCDPMRYTIAILILLLLPIGLTGCGPSLDELSSAQVPSSVEQAVEYRLGSEDKVRLTVFGEPQLSGEFLVDQTGIVSMPLVGQVKAGGLTVREFEKNVVAKLREGYLQDPKVSTEVINFRPIYVIGEVNKPGQYPYVSDMTVSKAVALANGYTYRASESSVVIIRGGKSFKSAAGAQTKLLPGDEVRIPERYF